MAITMKSDDRIKTLRQAYKTVLESIKDRYPNDYTRADFVCSEHNTLDDLARMIQDIHREEAEEEQMVMDMEAYSERGDLD